MKRLHVHVAVKDILQSIGFYSALFAAQPAVVKSDYAKWMLDDPRVNFAISTRGREPGLDHLGIQVEDAGELHEVYARLREAGGNIIEQGETACCYAKSEKSWIDDPAGIRVGDVLDHRRKHRLRRWHGREYGARGAPEARRLLRTGSRACQSHVGLLLTGAQWPTRSTRRPR
jgi:catechol 2,3-dioxygenase-like lactoylglutathione lyase family enzyme